MTIKPRILTFLENEVADYVVPDIQRLAQIRPEGPKGLGSCATSEAMLLFAVMDYFGYLLREDREEWSDTLGNLTQLFGNRLAGFPTEYATRARMLTKLYRHGLMHQIFPKAAGIRKAGLDQPLFAHFDGLDHLNIDRLADDVLALIRRLQSELPNHPDICNRMSRRMDRISVQDFDDERRLRQRDAD